MYLLVIFVKLQLLGHILDILVGFLYYYYNCLIVIPSQFEKLTLGSNN